MTTGRCRSPPVVFACENPAVVAAAADEARAVSRPLVCVDGVPSTAALVVVDALATAGSEIRYHGDFDWRGLMIAGVVARKIPNAAPWRHTASEYRRALDDGLGSVELDGNPVQSPWDPELASVMEHHGLAIYEEHVLAELLTDLTA